MYFGKRYLNTSLQRWVSADPLTIHKGGADPNVYAYVVGQALKAVDPHGLDATVTVTGNDVVVSTKVLVSGPDANKHTVAELQKSSDKFFAGRTWAVDIGGRSYNVSFDIDFELQQGREPSEGENTVTLDRGKGDVEGRDAVSEVKWNGREGRFRPQDMRRREDGSITTSAAHEMLHMFGVIDRYDERSPKLAPHTGWEDKLSGGLGRMQDLDPSELRQIVGGAVRAHEKKWEAASRAQRLLVALALRRGDKKAASAHVKTLKKFRKEFSSKHTVDASKHLWRRELRNRQARGECGRSWGYCSTPEGAD